MAAVMFGNGLSGFGTVCLRGVTLLIWPGDKNDKNEFRGAFALYMIGFTILFGCTLAQVCLRKNKYAIYCLRLT